MAREAAMRRWRKWSVATVVLVALVVCSAAVVPASTGIGADVAGAAPPALLDHPSRSAVRASYRDVLVPALAVPLGWTGNAATCTAGAPSVAARDAALTAVNWFRSLAGVPPVTFDPTLNAKAQQAALMMLAADDLSHTPDPSWPCFTEDGAAAAGSSNLAWSSAPPYGGARAILGYLTDDGPGNERVGHRRWVLYPNQVTMGSGFTSRTDALHVIGAFGPRPATAPDWSPWPTAGYFPGQIEPEGRWSVSRAGADFSNATVTVTRDGVAVPVTKQPLAYNRGDNTLVWQFDTGFALGGADNAYQVTIGGVVVDEETTGVTYTVRLFDANLTTPSAPTGVKALAGLGSARVSWTPPASDGGSPVYGYLAVASPSGASCTVTGAASACIVPGVPDGEPQTFTVWARNVVGPGEPSAASAPITSGQSCGPGGAGPFLDVPGAHVFCADIQWLRLSGVSTGNVDGTFSPSVAVSRQAMAAFLYRLKGRPDGAHPACEEAPFTDVPVDSVFCGEIAWMKGSGVTTGYGDGTFRPNGTVERQAMAAFLYRYADKPDGPAPACGDPFTDVHAGTPFCGEITWMKTAGISTGNGDGSFSPNQAVSRQAMAAFLHRLAPS